MSEVGREEFYRAMDSLEAGLKGIHSRLDALNGRTRLNESAIAVLDERVDAAEGKSKTWTGALAGGMVVGVIELFKWLAGRH